MTGTSWVFNEVPNLSTLPYDSCALFLESGPELDITHNSIYILWWLKEPIFYYNVESGWTLDSYRNVGPFRSGGQATDTAIIDWFYENATLQS